MNTLYVAKKGNMRKGAGRQLVDAVGETANRCKCGGFLTIVKDKAGSCGYMAICEQGCEEAFDVKLLVDAPIIEPVEMTDEMLSGITGDEEDMEPVEEPETHLSEEELEAKEEIEHANTDTDTDFDGNWGDGDLEHTEHELAVIAGQDEKPEDWDEEQYQKDYTALSIEIENQGKARQVVEEEAYAELQGGQPDKNPEPVTLDDDEKPGRTRYVLSVQPLEPQTVAVGFVDESGNPADLCDVCETEMTVYRSIESNAYELICQKCSAWYPVEEFEKLPMHDLTDRTPEYKAHLIDLDFYEIPKKQRAILDIAMSGCYITQRAYDGAFFAYRPFGTIDGRASKRLDRGEVKPLLKKGLLVKASFQGGNLADTTADDDFGDLLTDVFTMEDLENLQKQEETIKTQAERDVLYQTLRNTVVADTKERLEAQTEKQIIDAVTGLIVNHLGIAYKICIEYLSVSSAVSIKPADNEVAWTPTLRIEHGIVGEWAVQDISFSGGLTLFTGNPDKKAQKTIEAHQALLRIGHDLMQSDNVKELEAVLYQAMKPINAFYHLRTKLSQAYTDKEPTNVLTDIALEIGNI